MSVIDQWPELSAVVLAALRVPLRGSNVRSEMTDPAGAVPVIVIGLPD